MIVSIERQEEIKEFSEVELISMWGIVEPIFAIPSSTLKNQWMLTTTTKTNYPKVRINIKG